MRRDAAVGGLLALLSLFLLWQTREIPTPPLLPLGPAFYPRVVLAVLVVLSLIMVVSGLRAPAAARVPDWRAWFARYRPIVAVFALFGLYVLAMPVLGYPLSTVLFVAVMQWLLGRRGWRRLPAVLAVAVGTALVTWVVFERYLFVFLPRGIFLR